ncbi:MAG: hypothetical protein QNI99_18250 [Woeseiaceae bacterium]|nr:hypothetical protein [Woeseiaceae bacterium]
MFCSIHQVEPPIHALRDREGPKEAVKFADSVHGIRSDVEVSELMSPEQAIVNGDLLGQVLVFLSFEQLRTCHGDRECQDFLKWLLALKQNCLIALVNQTDGGAPSYGRESDASILVGASVGLLGELPLSNLPDDLHRDLRKRVGKLVDQHANRDSLAIAMVRNIDRAERRRTAVRVFVAGAQVDSFSAFRSDAQLFAPIERAPRSQNALGQLVRRILPSANVPTSHSGVDIFAVGAERARDLGAALAALSEEDIRHLLTLARTARPFILALRLVEEAPPAADALRELLTDWLRSQIPELEFERGSVELHDLNVSEPRHEHQTYFLVRKQEEILNESNRSVIPGVGALP